MVAESKKKSESRQRTTIYKTTIKDSKNVIGITGNNNVVNKNSKSQDGTSIADLAKMGFSKITDLSKSQKVTDKLIGLNGLLVILILSIISTNYFVSGRIVLTYLIIFPFMALLSTASMVLYMPFLETVSNLVENNISGLRFSIYFLFFALMFISLGLSFNLIWAQYVAYALLFLQIVVTLLGSALPKSDVENKEISFKGLWTILTKFGVVVGIISGITTIISFFLKLFSIKSF
ncbi:MAG: hypothetical protein HYW23_00505 [Candidatus Aenigmarchaeota archaeon]|nr:hypothetical protein [Candidatus Aenigmarchaeota archaeon]